MSVGAVNKQTGDRIPTAGMPAIDDELSLSSTNPVQNAVITNTLALKQDATDNSLQTTDKTVVGAVNELKSGLTDVNAALSVPEGSGKNLIPMTVEGIKAANTAGTWSNNTYTYRGISYTLQTNTNGKVVGILVNGTNTASAASEMTTPLCTIDSNYILSGCPSGGSENTYSLAVWRNGTIIVYDTGNGAIVPAGEQQISVRVRPGVTVDNTFYPMLRPATITDPTFAPYIPSVESRIEAVESNLTGNWRQVTFADVFTFAQDVTASSEQNCVAWVRGDRVRIKLFVRGSITTTSTGYKTIGNVSNNYRPANNTIMPGFVNSKSDGTQMLAPASYAINTNGNINLLYGDTSTLGSAGSDWLGGNSILFEWAIK